jgi:hypothetical protein
MLCTRSGGVLIGGRFPGVAVQISHDHGYTWRFHQIDTVGWANGGMLEIEPDVVLFLYGGRHELRYTDLADATLAAGLQLVQNSASTSPPFSRILRRARLRS